MTSNDLVSHADHVRSVLTAPEPPHHTPGVRLVTTAQVWLVTNAFRYSDTEQDRPDVWTTRDEALDQARRAITDARARPSPPWRLAGATTRPSRVTHASPRRPRPAGRRPTRRPRPAGGSSTAGAAQREAPAPAPLPELGDRPSPQELDLLRSSRVSLSGLWPAGMGMRGFHAEEVEEMELHTPADGYGGRAGGAADP
ncbi:hypothetical protein [Streptomyces sp. 8K308]|uniref:hypothetical protein n=1 Tax=Streptomyces sp. 8K308 TaxID=2530388 RepID=UPI00140485B4|nr:hypothetical protein [Streptomyces sp. 8K308]